MKAFSNQRSAVSLTHGAQMSATFYISPTKPDTLNFDSDMDINLDEFVNGLKKVFPGVDVYSQDTSHMIIYWELNWTSTSYDDAKDSMWGEMSNNRLWVYIDAHSKLETIAKFAKWYRKLVPDTYQLFVAPSWSMESFELVASMDEEGIMQSVHGLES